MRLSDIGGKINEAAEDTFVSALKGLKSWQVVIMNNYYRGKYSDYSGRYFYVLATSPEEARQVVLDNADAILKDLLAMKAHNGRSILPRSSAVRITADRIGKIEDGTEAGRMSTSGFKKMYSPQGPMMVKLSNGAIADVQGQEQGVAEGYILKKTNVSKYMEPGDPDEYTQDVNIKDTDYEIINNKTGQVVGTASWTTNDFMGPGALKIIMKNGATRYLDIWDREKGNPQSAFNRFVKDPKTAKKYKDEQGVAEGDKKPHPKTWHDVDAKLGKQVDKMTQAEKVKKGLAHPDTLKKKGVAEGAKVDRMVKHIAKSEREAGKSKEEAENIAWATVNKRGYLDNKNKKKGK